MFMGLFECMDLREYPLVKDSSWKWVMTNGFKHDVICSMHACVIPPKFELQW